jgi:hypothetical protein
MDLSQVVHRRWARNGFFSEVFGDSRGPLIHMDFKGEIQRNQLLKTWEIRIMFSALQLIRFSGKL